MSGAFDTLELRWFHTGGCPREVHDWFVRATGTGAKSKVVPRRDLYFLMMGREDAGLKLRGAKLQLKLRHLSRRTLLPEGRGVGSIERWSRYSWGVASGGVASEGAEDFRAETIVGERGLRIMTEKSRRQVTLELSPDAFLKPTARVRREPGHLGVELVELKVQDGHYWGLCFELGVEAEDEAALANGAASFLAGYPGPALSFENSYGYPHLLGRIVQSAELSEPRQ